MKKVLPLVFAFLGWISGNVSAQQQPAPPDIVFGDLFVDVQMNKVFPDGKTFVDCVPKRDPKAIVADYAKMKKSAKKAKTEVDLKKFIEDNFEIPAAPNSDYKSDASEDVTMHIKKLWSVLKRPADKPVAGSSLLALPNPYIVPGGRFREIYYWDSYFTMLGLKESGENEMIENMIKNFAYLINTYGHIPNGARTYYLGRSQPPFFACMVQLLAEVKGDGVYTTYLPALEKEYQFFMEGADQLKPGEVHRRVVKLADGTILNRYWDDMETPRQESYREDFEVAQKSGRDIIEMYHHLRAGAESGIDFSSRWFADDASINTIQTTDYIAVDLNSLLYNLEKVLALSYKNMKSDNIKISSENTTKAAAYELKAEKRRKAIEKYCWNDKAGYYADYNFKLNKSEDNITLAAMYPLFFSLADRDRAAQTKTIVLNNLLKPGGLSTTMYKTGEQWDAPNGWAPLQWMAIQGLERYGFSEDARNVAHRWIKLNVNVYKRTGKLMEKYNVVDTHLDAGGGEYPGQDGFGWTNGVLLKLINVYGMPSE
ncbi:MAG: alpha,alpha-trehalase [Bacteroidetes bacterium]|nr:MAG: alpha,alpha-trehalase [Bacteroidota bacterium]